MVEFRNDVIYHAVGMRRGAADRRTGDDVMMAIRCAAILMYAASVACTVSAASATDKREPSQKELVAEAEETAAFIREMIAYGVGDGRHEKVTIGSGTSAMRGTLQATTARGITVKTGAAVVDVPWERLSSERLYLIGKAYMPAGDAWVHLRLARFCIAHGLAAHARDELASAASDPDLAADVALSETLLKGLGRSAATPARGPAEPKKSRSESGLGPLPEGLPDWLGTRPPVEGDWVKTLDDEFDGDALDLTIWNHYGPNYWDKVSHWSKDNTVVGGGVVRLRYEKKTGHHNDDSGAKESPYTSGFLETYGKWVQRYGYFEARMKLPTAPGLWPAFWMMPDRGVEVGPQWVRQDTGNGGMEFDIMEHLTRWGPARYNIAMHWDGYGNEHKATGSDRVIVTPDTKGDITAGLLWTPGSAVFYCNGTEVYRYENARVSSVRSDLMFTLVMGGWDNSPLEDAKLPDEWLIDYVRVWQRRDLASSVDGRMGAKAGE